MCLTKIELASNMKKTEITYDVPQFIFGYAEYNITDCLSYIDDKLKDMKLETIVFKKSIYVSWANF